MRSTVEICRQRPHDWWSRPHGRRVPLRTRPFRKTIQAVLDWFNSARARKRKSPG